jgi:hypothetical protein
MSSDHLQAKLEITKKIVCKRLEIRYKQMKVYTKTGDKGTTLEEPESQRSYQNRKLRY